MENNSYLLISSNNKYIKKYIDLILDKLDKYEIIDMDGKNFLTVQLEKLNMIYSQKKQRDFEQVFIIRDFNNLSNSIQSKLLVKLENLEGGRTFVLTSTVNENILDTIKSRSIVFEDNNFNNNLSETFTPEELNEIKDSIKENNMTQFDKLLIPLENVKQLKPFLLDIVKLSEELSLSIEKVNSLLELHETILVASSIKVAKIKLMNTLF